MTNNFLFSYSNSFAGTVHCFPQPFTENGQTNPPECVLPPRGMHSRESSPITLPRISGVSMSGIPGEDFGFYAWVIIFLPDIKSCPCLLRSGLDLFSFNSFSLLKGYI